MSADPVVFLENPLKPQESNQIWFDRETQKNEAESDKQGVPVFDTVLIAHIRGPGLIKSDANMWCERTLQDGTVVVNPTARQRYGQMIDAFKSGETDGLTGTPLAELVILDMGMRASLKALGVHSIEALAAMNETAAPGMMGFRKYKTAAQAYLDLAAGQAPINKITAELDAEKEKNRQLQADHDDLVARVRALEESWDLPAKRGPGRPPKIAAAA